MLSPAATVDTILPLATLTSNISLSSVNSKAPSAPRETRTFFAPRSCSFSAYFKISSILFKVTPNISPSSNSFGLTTNGLY